MRSSIFLCVSWPVVYVFWRNFYLNPLYVFKLVAFFLLSSLTFWCSPWITLMYLQLETFFPQFSFLYISFLLLRDHLFFLKWAGRSRRFSSPFAFSWQQIPLAKYVTVKYLRMKNIHLLLIGIDPFHPTSKMNHASSLKNQ